MKTAMDIDGVICDVIPLMVKAIEERGFTVTFDRYNPYIEGIDNIEKFMYEIVREIYSKQMKQIPAYKGSRKAVLAITRDLGPITFITARQERWNEGTIKWLWDQFGIPFDLVNKSSSDKAQFILDEGFDVFIEDRLRTANAASELGIKTYLLNRPWNKGRPTHKNMIRVDSIWEFYVMEMAR